MHFHELAKCQQCMYLRAFTTPIPAILLLASMCEICEAWEMIGLRNGVRCPDCLEVLELDAQQAWGWGSTTPPAPR